MPRKKLTHEQFVERSKIKHGDKYDYTLVDYISNSTPVKIICPIHGIFEQRPNNHFNGKGCMKCHIDKNKLKKTEFINRSIIKHNNKYDYSKVNYIDSKTKVKIICPEHGIFEQTPIKHLNSIGCDKCNKKRNYTNIEFIHKAKEKHKNKYDYSITLYKNSKTNINIICPIHGVFKQSASNHLMGQGCPKCANKNITTSDIINKAKEKHKNKYDYSLVEYINSHTKISIICPIHGLFKQYSYHHIIGCGCPKCNSSHGERDIISFLEKYNISYVHQHKFDNCRNKRNLFFDFYLPDYQICIEFDGIQHFKPIKKFGGEVKFLNTLKRDEIKNKYCEDNNISLMRIRYTDKIEDILNNNLIKK